MRWLLVALLLLTAAVLGCSGQALLPQACPDPEFFSTPSNDEKVQFLDNECMMTCENNMNDLSVTLCINPCGATNITFLAAYKSNGLRYVRLSIPNDGTSSFSANLEFNYNETTVSLALHYQKIITHAMMKQDGSMDKTFLYWLVTHGRRYLPFRIINSHEQCDSSRTTPQAIVNTESTSTTASLTVNTNTLLTTSSEETPSADDDEGQPEVILAENKCVFAASGVICFILVAIIIAAVYHVRKKRSHSKPGREGRVENHGPECTKEAPYVDVLGHEELDYENLKTTWTSGAPGPSRTGVVGHELSEISAKLVTQNEGVVYHELPDFISLESEGRVYYDDEGNRV